MGQVILQTGEVASVDDEDLKIVLPYKWRLVGKGYASVWYKRLYMHRLVMEALPDQIVDHINGNTLDNRKCNLRICDKSQNMMNSKRRKDAESPYRGVTRNTGCATWTARLGSKYLGSYKTAEEAAVAYDTAALEKYKDFARLNFTNK